MERGSQTLAIDTTKSLDGKSSGPASTNISGFASGGMGTTPAQTPENLDVAIESVANRHTIFEATMNGLT